MSVHSIERKRHRRWQFRCSLLHLLLIGPIAAGLLLFFDLQFYVEIKAMGMSNNDVSYDQGSGRLKLQGASAVCCGIGDDAVLSIAARLRDPDAFGAAHIALATHYGLLSEIVVRIEEEEIQCMMLDVQYYRIGRKVRFVSSDLVSLEEKWRRFIQQQRQLPIVSSGMIVWDGDALLAPR